MIFLSTIISIFWGFVIALDIIQNIAIQTFVNMRMRRLKHEQLDQELYIERLNKKLKTITASEVEKAEKVFKKLHKAEDRLLKIQKEIQKWDIDALEAEIQALELQVDDLTDTLQSMDKIVEETINEK